MQNQFVGVSPGRTGEILNIKIYDSAIYSLLNKIGICESTLMKIKQMKNMWEDTGLLNVTW